MINIYSLAFFLITLILSLSLLFKKKYRLKSKGIVPKSVNYHFTRLCNYQCGFCFHTSKDDSMVDIETAKKGLKLLKDQGMEKINFAGGEPFLYPKFLGELVKFCRTELKINVSIVSNGSKIRKSWFDKYGEYLSILAISCDSFDEEINKNIGRGNGKHLNHVFEVSKWCKEYNIKFKINTVVNKYNWKENMVSQINQLNPFRWKVFQVLVLDDENSGNDTIRDARRFIVSNEEFKHFCKTHSSLGDVMVPESNEQMRNSYLILDEKLRFLDCSGGGKSPSDCILDGVQKALQQSGFDENMFHNRGGVYDYSKPQTNDSCGSNSTIDW